MIIISLLATIIRYIVSHNDHQVLYAWFIASHNNHGITITPTDAFHKDLVGIISTTTIGLFAIIVILVSVTIGFSVQH